jgi:hypothetical protein
LPQVEFSYNASRALDIEHTPFKANYGFSPEEHPDLLLPMRPSIPISTFASERLQQLCEVHELSTFVIQARMDDMQAHSQP